MKKLILTLMALTGTISINAQIIKVMKGETVVATFTPDKADKVVFEKAPEPPEGSIGKEKRNGDTDVKWVQLWKDGPKFAEYNIGAANNKPEDHGGYYTWGGTYKNGPGITGEIDFNTTKDVTSNLTGDEDTATKLWGNNWRMPTKEELDLLRTNCDATWTVNYIYNDSGIKGTIFTGRGAYATNSIFLPATGYFNIKEGKVSGLGDYGQCWSSTPKDSESAYYMFFGYKDNGVVNTAFRSIGYSVRAVLKE